MLGYLKERARNRVQNWEGKLLNKSGKEILLKTVAQAIPNYAMSVFLLPIEMCREMEKMMCKFWWKTSTKKDRSIHWMSWDRMCTSKMYGGLGFRHLHDFNLALLGKQGWRLITNPDSLVAKIFKARYYPRNNFLTASLGGSPSFVWRSVFEAQSLIKQGMAYRVANGESISISNDPWLPDDANPYVQTVSDSLQGRLVSSLFHTEEPGWDTDLVRDVFEDRDANIILAIPWRIEDEDRWYWRKEKSGNYSVKSAYHIIQQNKSYSNSTGNISFWKRMWNLKVPPKVKHFFWRAATDCLPTKSLLRSRHVNVNALCPLCNMEVETTSHILLACSYGQACWAVLCGSAPVCTQESFIQWLTEVFDSWSIDNRQMGVMLCWSLWKSRNELVWNQKGLEIVDVVESARVVLSQWQRAQDRNFDQSWGLFTPDDGAEHWTLPMVNKTKVNTDAAIFSSHNRFCTAFVARDHKREMLYASSSCKLGQISPENAEVMGIREVLSWIKGMHMHEVEVETDCLVAVQAIRSSSALSSYFGRFVQDCRMLLSELKDKGVSLRFVRRSANNVAHFLAGYSYSLADCVWRVNDNHPELLSILKNDLKK